MTRSLCSGFPEDNRWLFQKLVNIKSVWKASSSWCSRVLAGYSRVIKREKNSVLSVPELSSITPESVLFLNTSAWWMDLGPGLQAKSLTVAVHALWRIEAMLKLWTNWVENSSLVALEGTKAGFHKQEISVGSGLATVFWALARSRWAGKLKSHLYLV